MIIYNIRLAYKIGFSSALNQRVISAYKEAAKYDFGDDPKLKRRLVRVFCKGFSHGNKFSIAVRRERDIVTYKFLEPAHALLFS